MIGSRFRTSLGDVRSRRAWVVLDILRGRSFQACLGCFGWESESISVQAVPEKPAPALGLSVDLSGDVPGNPVL